MSMLLHCGGEEVTRAMVEAVPVPEATRTWKPLPYKQVIDFIHHQADKHLGLPVIREQYGLNKVGDQLFGLLTLDTGREEGGLSIGFRDSYNKSIARGVAVGEQVFVCDNLCFSGSAFKVVRRHTLRGWDDFRSMVVDQMHRAFEFYEQTVAQNDAMKEIPVGLERGYEILGLARGVDLLTPTQSSVAFGDWKEARHPEFSDRNLWSLYNCATEALKKGPPGRRLDRQARVHDFFMALEKKASPGQAVRAALAAPAEEKELN